MGGCRKRENIAKGKATLAQSRESERDKCGGEKGDGDKCVLGLRPKIEAFLKIL